jgi:hypothetical protein
MTEKIPNEKLCRSCWENERMEVGAKRKRMPWCKQCHAKRMKRFRQDRKQEKLQHVTAT